MATCCATEACHSRKAAKLRFKIEDAGGGGGGCRSVLFVSTLDDGYGAVLQHAVRYIAMAAAVGFKAVPVTKSRYIAPSFACPEAPDAVGLNCQFNLSGSCAIDAASLARARPLAGATPDAVFAQLRPPRDGVQLRGQLKWAAKPGLYVPPVYTQWARELSASPAWVTFASLPPPPLPPSPSPPQSSAFAPPPSAAQHVRTPPPPPPCRVCPGHGPGHACGDG